MPKRAAVVAIVYVDLYKTTIMNDQTQNYFRYFQNKKVLIGGAAVLLILFILLLFLNVKKFSNVASTSSEPTVSGGSQTNQVMNMNQVQQTNQPGQTSQTSSVSSAALSIEKLSTTSAAVVINTGNKPVSAVQLAISFDPIVVKNISIIPDEFFKRALVLMNKVDYATGTIFYAAVVPPNAPPQQGKGVVARLSFNFARGSINPTNLDFLPNTKVTARGVDSSILKQSSGITIATNSWQ
jgi:hypothetical protein